jgi:hypothetical protein
MLVALTEQGERLADQALRPFSPSTLPQRARRYVPRSSKDDLEAVQEKEIKPNRTLPKPGEDYEGARKRAAMG